MAEFQPFRDRGEFLRQLASEAQTADVREAYMKLLAEWEARHWYARDREMVRPFVRQD
jgi:hypothetical protein